MLKRQKRVLKRYLYILGAIIIIILLVLLIIKLLRNNTIEDQTHDKKGEALTESQTLKKLTDCDKMLTDVKVSHEFKRQLNSLTCFKELAEAGADEKNCLQLPAKSQIYCLAPFARNKNNPEICKLAKGDETIKTCLTMAIKNSDECQKYLNSCSEQTWPLFEY